MPPTKLTDLLPDPNNANRGTERGRYMLEQSLRKLGAGRSILLDKHGKIIAGNKTAETAAEIGLDDVIIVQTDGRQVVAVQRTDLDLDDPTGAARELAYADNRVSDVSLDFDPAVIAQDMAAGLDLGDWFFDDEIEFMAQLDEWRAAEPERKQNNGGGGPGALKDVPLPEGVPDTIWPTDNAYGIPLLDPTRQADAFDIPMEIWGAKRRGKSAGTVLFYTNDGRFEGLWANPHHLLESGAVNAVEPNFSVYKDFPRAVVLWHTYRKRWLARYWQSQGVRIFVDLNVHPSAYADNLIGVPKGWKAYATRGYSARLDHTEQELQLAQEHAGGPVLFLVYGGGKAVKDWCQARAGDGVAWVAEDMDVGKGKYADPTLKPSP